MKKIKKGSEPVELADFVNENPRGSWNEFRNDRQGASYQAVRRQAALDQGSLCAYCEVQFDKNNQQASIEHFHPKADVSDPNINWALNWQNMLAVCRGGREGDKDQFPTPENLSCDAYKDHVGGSQELLNPLNAPLGKIYQFDKATGELHVDPQLECCVVEQVKQAIKILNLNCYRLRSARLTILNAYNREIKKAREKNNRQIKHQLVERWFGVRWPSYFTTRRCLLGNTAESYLKKIAFEG